jgi:hypothetical protein
MHRFKKNEHGTEAAESLQVHDKYIKFIRGLLSSLSVPHIYCDKARIAPPAASE